MYTRKIQANLPVIMLIMTKRTIGVMKILNLQKKLKILSLAVQEGILSEEKIINNIQSPSHSKIIKKMD